MMREKAILQGKLLSNKIEVAYVMGRLPEDLLGICTDFIFDLLEHPVCPKCGCQKLRGDCGHVWEIL